MAETEQDKMALQVAGQADSGGAKRISVDDDGKVNVVLPNGTNVIGKVRLVTASGDEITDDTQDAAKGYRTKAGLSQSGLKTTSGQIKASAGEVYWLSLSDADALAIQIKDSTEDSGDVPWGIELPADGYAHFIFDPPIECGTGIYLKVVTGTPNVYMGYK